MISCIGRFFKIFSTKTVPSIEKGTDFCYNVMRKNASGHSRRITVRRMRPMLIYSARGGCVRHRYTQRAADVPDTDILGAQNSRFNTTQLKRII